MGAPDSAHPENPAVDILGRRADSRGSGSQSSGGPFECGAVKRLHDELCLRFPWAWQGSGGQGEMGIDGQLPVLASSAALRELHRVITGIHTHRDLTGTAQAVADIVVQAVGFPVAAVSVACPGGGLSIIAVAGSDAAGDQLLGTHRPLSAYEQEFAVPQRWGTSQFVLHDRLPDAATQSPKVRNRPGSVAGRSQSLRS